MAVRVLCAGDLHIGRQTSKVSRPHRTADAWLAIVELAIREQVDLVALSGDVIDKVGKSYESRGPLAAGLQRLQDAAIDVVAVTGNHDHDVLSAIAGQPGFEHLRLLGAGEQWEQFTLRRGDADVLHILGWSFAHEYVHVSPLPMMPRIERAGLPILGLLHAEVGVAGSPYGPASLADFRGHDVDFWLLGHIHKPWHYAADHVLYPGSPYAMDPGEPGVHGAWLLTLDFGKAPDLSPILPLAPVEYRTLVLDVSEISDEPSFQGFVHDAIVRDADLARAAHAEHLAEISLRLHLTGASAAHRQIVGWAQRFREETDFSGNIVPISIDTLATSVRVPIDLNELAGGNDPAAELARLLLSLDQHGGSDQIRGFMDGLGTELNELSQSPSFSQLRDDEHPLTVNEAEVRTLIRDRSWRLLSSLMSTKEAAG